MDFLRIGAGAALVLTFAGAVVIGHESAPVQADVLGLAVCGQDHSSHGADEMAAHMAMMAENATPGHAALIETMEPMHADMMRGLAAATFDAAFVCSMIPHHQGAVDMARAALEHGEDPFVRMLAHQVILDQEQEIGEMVRWLERREAAAH